MSEKGNQTARCAPYSKLSAGTTRGKKWLINRSHKTEEEILADRSEVKQNFTELLSPLLDFAVYSEGVGTECGGSEIEGKEVHYQNMWPCDTWVHAIQAHDTR